MTEAAAVTETALKLLTLPADLLVPVLSFLDARWLGRAETACAGLSHGSLWRALCSREGLPVGAAAPKAVLRRAHECDHHAGAQPSDAFEWERARGDVHVRAARCACARCGRAYDVCLTAGFVDTAAFSSKLVCRAEFRARHAAPLRHREWLVVWDAAAAAAAKAAAPAALKGVVPKGSRYALGGFKPIGRSRGFASTHDESDDD